MKIKNRIYTVLLGIIVLSSVFSCGDNDSPLSNNLEQRIVGKWFVKEKTQNGKKIDLYGSFPGSIVSCEGQYGYMVLALGGSGSELSYLVGFDECETVVNPLSWKVEGKEIIITKMLEIGGKKVKQEKILSLVSLDKENEKLTLQLKEVYEDGQVVLDGRDNDEDGVPDDVLWYLMKDEPKN